MCHGFDSVGIKLIKLLDKIDHALEKIKNGDYGICEMCGEDIAVARLEARPVALYCIDCKTAQEHRERQYSDDTEGDDAGWSADVEDTAD